MVTGPQERTIAAPRRDPGRLRFAVLGPLEARDGDEVLDLGPFKQRVLLAALLCRANTVMPVSQLIDVIWDRAQPRTARKNLQVYISALRKIIGDRIGHLGYGYTLRVAAGELDLLRFENLAVAGRGEIRDGDRDTGGRLLGEAVRLWRGRPLVDLMDSAFLAAESDRLTERYLAVYEDWAELEVEAGRHRQVIEPLSELARRYPFRERLTIALMTALSHGGGRKEALARYESHRQFIAQELGLDPSPVLQQLYRAILAGAPPAGPGASGGHPARPRTHHAKPAQLPRGLPDFVGRAAETAALATALSGKGQDSDVAVISGAPGTGKTALAVHAGHQLADRFTDGQVFISLRDDTGAPRPWRDVLAELMRGTGLEIPPPAGETAALALWRSWVADRCFLFVLDDAPGEASIRRLLPGRGPSRTLVTSVRRLSGLESVYRLELAEFSPAEAAELLERGLGQARVRAGDAAIASLMTRCGGTPLVIRAVTAKLSMLRHLSLREYAARLEAAPEPLAELAVGELSLRSRLHRCYTSLPPPLQEAFQALGALPEPPFAHDSAAAALSALAEPAERLLEELMEASLVAIPDDEVLAHSIRYTMPAAVYRYAVALHRAGLFQAR